jgi:hypothetical protein
VSSAFKRAHVKSASSNSSVWNTTSPLEKATTYRVHIAHFGSLTPKFNYVHWVIIACVRGIMYDLA